MRIQKSIKKAIDELCNKDFESAMLHICNAIDGTSQRKFGGESGKEKFKKFIREYYDYIGAMTGTYSLDYSNISWPITVKKPSGLNGKTDLADMIYGIHRCSHDHGVSVPDGFEFIADLGEKTETTSFNIQNGAIGLSDRFIWALIAIVVFEPVNLGLADPELSGYYIILGKEKFIINQWWGKLHDLPQLLPKTSRGILDFSNLV